MYLCNLVRINCQFFCWQLIDGTGLKSKTLKYLVSQQCIHPVSDIYPVQWKSCQHFCAFLKYIWKLNCTNTMVKLRHRLSRSCVCPICHHPAPAWICWQMSAIPFDTWVESCTSRQVLTTPIWRHIDVVVDSVTPTLCFWKTLIPCHEIAPNISLQFRYQQSQTVQICWQHIDGKLPALLCTLLKFCN